MELREAVRKLAERVRAAGGRALLVGGAVRDELLGSKSADFDIEVYGLAPERVLELAQESGTVSDVGKTFGVLEIRMNAETLHISLPRRESKIAPGHRGFSVGVDPSMPVEEALRRRDFTINAMARDPLTEELLDPYGGQRDLKQKILRIVDANTFPDDPLRVLRGAVFVAQFALAPDEASVEVLKAAAAGLKELPRARVGEEWKKLLLRSSKPSLGLKCLMDWGVLGALHPEFVPLSSTSQNPVWHPEGDVWTHTLMAVDEAAVLLQDSPEEQRWQVLLAVLCHDLGKAATTQHIRGAWRSPGHAAAGVEPTRRFLQSIAASRRTTEVVIRLVREHLVPLLLFNAEAKERRAGDGALRSLARRLHPATIFLLTLVADADHRGRAFPVGKTPAALAGERLRKRAEALGILHGLPQPVLRGDDLVALGLKPGPAFGKILRAAETLRDATGCSREQVLELLRGARSPEDALEKLRTAG